MSVRIRILMAAGLLPALLAAAVALAEPTPAARVAELQRAGHVAEALALCRQENTARPGDADMLYNQACLENRSGNAAAAADCLRAALAAGFDDLDFAQTDPDLQGAAKESVHALLDEHRRRLGELATQRGGRLAVGKPATFALAAPGGAGGTATLTVTWVATGLDLRLEADDTGSRFLPTTGASPWAGKGGVIVAVGDLPAGAGLTNDAFVFGFGSDKGAGVGSLFVVETGRWQRVRELQPKFRGAGTSHLIMDASIPWTAISPFHPLIDGALGLDVALLTADGELGPNLAPKKLWLQPDAAHVPVARLEFDLATAPAGALEGRTPATIINGRAVALNLAATADGDGDGTLTIDFRDGDGKSLLAAGPKEETVTLAKGLNAINRAVDFSQVRRGPCRIEVSLKLPSGLQSNWSTWLLNLGQGWQESYHAAIGKLPADEQPTAQYFLAAVTDGVARHRARRHPGALTTTLGDLNLMLARFKQTGSLLPAEGLAPFVYLGPGGADRLCHLVVPTGRPAGAKLQPIVLVGQDADDGPRLAGRIQRYLEQGPGKSAGEAATVADTTASKATAETTNRAATNPAATTPAAWPVFVIAAAEDPATGASPAAELRACVQWAQQRFSAGPVLLAAQRAAVAPALALTRDRDLRISRLLLFADETLSPWPGATPAELDRRVGPPPPRADLTWVNFAQETALGGQGVALREALGRQGWPVQDIKAHGGSNFTQIADYTCLWRARAATPGR